MQIRIKRPATTAIVDGAKTAVRIGVSNEGQNSRPPREAQASEEDRAHRYVITIRRERRGFEVLVVDVGGHSGGWQEAVVADLPGAFAAAFGIQRDTSHSAFGAPVRFEGGGR